MTVLCSMTKQGFSMEKHLLEEIVKKLRLLPAVDNTRFGTCENYSID